MPTDDTYPHAEERRIFYVALTRARRQVRIYTSNLAVSEFLTELIEDGLIKILSTGNEEITVCAGCRRGVEVPRSGPTGKFIGCSRFPACDHTRNISSERGANARRRAPYRTAGVKHERRD
jgi:DNA helicase-4